MIDYKTIANKIRKQILKISYEAQSCHIGSALSCVYILVKLFWETLKKDDVFLFAKASGIAAYYCILAEKGIIEENKLAEYLKNYPLASKEVPGVIHSIGSLGHGLSVACGIALAKKLKKESGRVYCLISDGELQEGSTYEALLFARQYRLPLITICDYNVFQACGEIKNILEIPYLDFACLQIIPTTKGQGVSFMENKVEWHYRNLLEEEYEKALLELNS